MQRVNAQVANRLFATFEFAGTTVFPKNTTVINRNKCRLLPTTIVTFPITNRCVRNSAIMISALNLVASGTHTVTSSYFGQIRLKRLSYSIRSVAPGRS